ncbi:MAG: hypothetical protein HGB11_01465 [Chlorobiales bacterium]|nr:hypothetical protein [Chlorobiales bacterium]
MVEKNTTESGSAEITKCLADMNGKGGFPISVITDLQGFTIASSSANGHDPERQSAVVAMVQKTAIQVRTHLGMGLTDEISLFDQDGHRLVCRPFSARGHELILAVQVPDRNQAYRGLTNQVIKVIQKIWKL